MLEDDEDPLSGAAREVREEIGLAAGKMERLGDFFMAPGYSTEHMHVFLATNLYPAPLPQDQDEFLSVSRIPARKALEMARNGQIHDGKTLAALLLAEPYLNLK
jgi:ADP-ribose pyrophosphatase